MTSKDLATRQETALASGIERPRGLEEQSLKEDLIIPIAKLFHGLPKEYEKFPAARPGQILNSITQEELPTDFIPVFKFYQWVYFNPRRENEPGFVREWEGKPVKPGDVVWRSTNPYDQRVITYGAFGPNGEKPLATKFISFLAYFPGVEMPIIIGFAKTSLKAGRTLLTTLEFSKGPVWERRFKLTAKKETGEFTYYILNVTPAGFSTDEERLVAAEWYERYSPKKDTLDVHVEAQESDDKGF